MPQDMYTHEIILTSQTTKIYTLKINYPCCINPIKPYNNKTGGQRSVIGCKGLWIKPYLVHSQHTIWKGLSELIFFGGSDYYRNLHKHALDQIPLGHPWDTQVFAIGCHPWSRGHPWQSYLVWGDHFWQHY